MEPLVGGGGAQNLQAKDPYDMVVISRYISGEKTFQKKSPSEVNPCFLSQNMPSVPKAFFQPEPIFRGLERHHNPPTPPPVHMHLSLAKYPSGLTPNSLLQCEILLKTATYARGLAPQSDTCSQCVQTNGWRRMHSVAYRTKPCIAACFGCGCSCLVLYWIHHNCTQVCYSVQNHGLEYALLHCH